MCVSRRALNKNSIPLSSNVSSTSLNVCNQGQALASQVVYKAVASSNRRRAQAPGLALTFSMVHKGKV